MSGDDQNLDDVRGEDNKDTGAGDPPAIDYEAEARKLGWRPESEYRGKGPFVGAKEFYEKGQVVLPIIKAENKALRDELVRVREAGEKLATHFKEAKDREVAELKQQLEAARNDRKQAISSGDGDAVEVAEAKMEDAKDKIKAAEQATATTPQLDPRFESWLNSEGTWYRDDARLRGIAHAILFNKDGSITKEFAHLQGRGAELYNAVGKAVDEIANSGRRSELDRPGPKGGGTGVDGGGGNRGGAPKRSYANLLPEYKKACDQQVRDFGVKDAAKFQASYVEACSDDAFKG